MRLAGTPRPRVWDETQRTFSLKPPDNTKGKSARVLRGPTMPVTLLTEGLSPAWPATDSSRNPVAVLCFHWAYSTGTFYLW